MYKRQDQDGVTYVSFLGQCKELDWEDVTEVKQSSGKRLVLAARDGTKITVGGSKNTYAEFIRLAARYIPPEAGDDVLRSIRASLKI